jgi:hypothetical protein
MTDESLTPKKREVLFWLDDANGFDRLGAEVMHDLDEYRVLQAVGNFTVRQRP